MANMVIMKNSSSAFEIKFPPKCNYKFSEIYVGLYIAHYTHFIRKLFFCLGSVWCWVVQSPPHRASSDGPFLGQVFLPRGGEAEERLGQLVLLQHVLHDCWAAPHRQAGVGHFHNPIKVWIVERVAGLILTQAKLVFINDNVLSLEWADRELTIQVGKFFQT